MRARDPKRARVLVLAAVVVIIILMAYFLV